MPVNRLDLENLLARLDPVVRGVSGPTLWKWDNMSDTLCFEPEMGAATMWARLADVLEYSPDCYPCTCAKDSVPGGHPAIQRLDWSDMQSERPPACSR